MLSLRRYVEERAARDDVLFLGIFTPDGATHIGNVKYEPVDECAGFAHGHPDWRLGVTLLLGELKY